jgi:hypothetical protein
MYNFWTEAYEECEQFLMMEDGAPYHQGVAGKLREQWEEMGYQGWGPGTWPSSSPDLNPIENLWHLLKAKIYKRRTRAKNREELIVALKEEWAKLDIEVVNSLCDSMPRRLQAVIDNKGGAAGY